MGQYDPPPGPPPGWSSTSEQYDPPPGPPPGRTDRPEQSAPPSYQDWMSIPDTSQLPPPPAINNTFSPTSNAEGIQADQAREWCKQHPLLQPHWPTKEQHAAGRSGNVTLLQPREYKGSLYQASPSIFRGNTTQDNRDASLVTSLPLYFAKADSCLATGQPVTLYFEVKILSIGKPVQGNESSLAIGYCAAPYPTWRMPGWERGSLAVHSDDGRRYVSDNEGGKDFTSTFAPGETVGLGITFSAPAFAQSSTTKPASEQSLDGEVFITRDGRRVGSWHIHEEVDAEHSWETLGLDGAYDLYGSVGVYGAVSFDVVFDPRQWLWRQ